MNNKIKKVCRALLVALNAALLLSTSALAESPRAPDATAWIFTIKPEKLEKYLDFPKSKLTSMTKFSVYFQPVELNQEKGKPTHYKDYYFDNGKAVGSKQIHTIDLRPDTMGPIMVKKAASGPTDTEAAASVATRLFLELYTIKSFPSFIVVDMQLFDDFIKGARHVGFSPLPQPPPPGIRPKAVLLVQSDPPGRRQFLMH